MMDTPDLPPLRIDPPRLRLQVRRELLTHLIKRGLAARDLVGERGACLAARCGGYVDFLGARQRLDIGKDFVDAPVPEDNGRDKGFDGDEFRAGHQCTVLGMWLCSARAVTAGRGLLSCHVQPASL